MGKIRVFFLMMAFVLSGCSTADVEQNEEKNLIVSAAVSLTEALEEIKTWYEAENDVNITFNFGGSGSLAQQIQQGAPVDVFISANQTWMDTLEEEGRLVPQTRIDLTGNSIVLIAGIGSELGYVSFEDIDADDVEQVAIGHPESVPAGMYTEGILKKLDKWDQMEDKLVLAKDVRQVLTYVETGNVDIGFVYASDALISNKIKVIAKASSSWHEPIIYPAAVIADTDYKEEAISFTTFMKTEEAQAIFKKYGFEK